MTKNAEAAGRGLYLAARSHAESPRTHRKLRGGTPSSSLPGTSPFGVSTQCERRGDSRRFAGADQQRVRLQCGLRRTNRRAVRGLWAGVLQGGCRRGRVRGVSCCLHAINVLSGDLVLLQRGLPAGERGGERACGACPAGTFKDAVDNTSEPGAGCALAHGCCACGANETKLAAASVHSDACVCLQEYAGLGRPRLRAVWSRLLQGGDERRGVPGLCSRRHDRLR